MLKILFRTVKASLSFKLLKYLILSSIISLIVFMVFAISMYSLVGLLKNYLPLSAYITAKVSAIGGLLVILWFSFPLLIPVCIAFFDQNFIKSLNTSLPAPDNSISLYKEITMNSSYIVKNLTYNVMCLPIYLIPIINVLIYYLLNGYLLSRQLWDIVWLPRMDAKQIKTLQLKYTLSLTILGVLLVLLTNIPIINLIAPLISITAMLYFSEYVHRLES